jgi:hypothetical protein
VTEQVQAWDTLVGPDKSVRFMAAVGLILVAAGLAAVFLIFRKVGGRRGPRFRRSLLIWYIVLGTCFWGLISWLVERPLSLLANVVPWGRLALAGLGIGLGGLGLGQLCLGSSLVYGLWRPNDALLIWFVIPVLIGFFLGFIGFPRWRKYQHRRSLERIGEKFVFRATHGDVVKPPEPHQRLGRLAYIGVGSLPLLIALILAVGSTDLEFAAFRVLGGALVSANFWLLDFAIQAKLLRDSRLSVRLFEIVTYLLALGLAASPVGEASAALIMRWPLASSLALMAIVALILAVRTMQRSISLLIPRSPSSLRLLIVPGAIYRIFFGKGLFLFLAVGVFHPEPLLLYGAVLLAIIELGIACDDVFRQKLSVLRQGEVSQFEGMFTCSDEHRMEMWGIWLFDAFWAHPARPDVSLILWLLRQAIQISHGQGNPLFVGPRAESSPTGQHALRWINLADEGLSTAEKELVPRWPNNHAIALRRALNEGRANSMLTKALLYQYLNRREEALEAWRVAAAEFEGLEYRQTAAVSRVSAASLLAGMLARPDDALRELEPVIADPSLSAIVVRHALNLASFLQFSRDNLSAARDLRVRARRIRVKRSDMRLVQRERTLDAPKIRRRTLEAGLTKIFGQQEDLVGILLGQSDEVRALPSSVDFPPRALTLRGMTLVMDGRIEEARAALSQAADLAETQGYLTWDFQANYDLGFTYLEENPVLALHYVRRALRVADGIRERVLAPDQRMNVAGQYEKAFARAVQLLLFEQQVTAKDWPERPIAAAFELVERARSRVFLEILGEAVQLAPPPDSDPLLAQERETLVRIRQEHDTLDTLSLEHRYLALSRLRDLRGALDAVWREVERNNPAGAEYAALRRGTPLDFDEIRTLLTL